MKKNLVFALLIVFIASVSLSSHQRWRESSRSQDQQRQNNNDQLSQIFILHFQHASRQGIRQESNMFKVEWNGRTIKEWTPKNYEIHTEAWHLQAKQGKNSIHFIGTGISDSYGQQVDNIRLERNSFCGFQDVIVNGGFQEGPNLGHGWRIFRNGQFKGWRCRDQIEVGWGRIYNPRWPDTHICELDAYRNSDIFQQFSLDEWLRLQH